MIGVRFEHVNEKRHGVVLFFAPPPNGMYDAHDAGHGSD